MPVDSTHPLYDEFLAKWIRARDVIAGEDAIKAAGEAYVPALDSQSVDEFRAYVARASFFNARKGFISDGNTTSTVVVPNSVATRIYALNNLGDAAGITEFVPGIDKGFFYDNGNFTMLDFPGFTQTGVLAVNDLGVFGGFADKHGVIGSVPEPGSTFTLLGLATAVLFGAPTTSKRRAGLGLGERSRGRTRFQKWD